MHCFVTALFLIFVYRSNSFGASVCQVINTKVVVTRFGRNAKNTSQSSAVPGGLGVILCPITVLYLHVEYLLAFSVLQLANC